MVKPKKSEINVWKTVESKSRHEHEKKRPKPNKKLPAKSSKQKDIKHASRARSFNKTPRHQVHRNRQWNNFSTSMPFSSCRSPMSMPWGTYFSLSYSCAPWFYNSYMPSLPRYWYPDYITYRESVIKEPPLMHSDRFDKENRSIQKKKYKVTKQVYCVKKDGILSKN